MMREIKFRAWCQTPPGHGQPGWLGDFDVSHDGKEVRAYGGMMPREHITLQQFTGLKDALGTEIYEGDILEIEGLLWGNRPARWIVEWDDHSVSTDERGGYVRSYGYIFEEVDHREAIVCGNIFENPDLAKSAI